MDRMRTLALGAVFGLLLLGPATSQRRAVQVYILAGQSNMEGKAQNVLWERQAVAADTREFFAPFRDAKNQQWVTRDDVFIKFLGKHGPLTLGFGSRGRTGLEYAFGMRAGDAHKQPVLLIKTAWGGRSIRKGFRPPSSGLPNESELTKELEQATKRIAQRNQKQGKSDPLPTMAATKAAYGKDYRAMIAEIRSTLADSGRLFPKLKGKKFELAGFVWFQGWNDQYGGAELEYERNMKHFINDVRRDLEADKLPFVIGVMGQNGEQPAKGAMLAIQNAQRAMPKVPEFVGNVLAIETAELQDAAAAAIYPEWKQRRDEWDQVGSDHPYHYLGSAIWYSRIGYATADAVLGLQKQ